MLEINRQELLHSKIQQKKKKQSHNLQYLLQIVLKIPHRTKIQLYNKKIHHKIRTQDLICFPITHQIQVQIISSIITIP